MYVVQYDLILEKSASGRRTTPTCFQCESNIEVLIQYGHIAQLSDSLNWRCLLAAYVHNLCALSRKRELHPLLQGWPLYRSCKGTWRLRGLGLAGRAHVV